jgi:tRNA pseudouridine38-40 synthase
VRLALKIAYDGRAFHGFARQPGLRTVEGEVHFALAKSHLVEDLDAANVRGSSRTDAGVSAIGNVIAFETDASEGGVIGRFNDAAKDVWAWASSTLTEGLDPRKANWRWYRYHLTREHSAAKLHEASRPFLGAHDFAAFASPDATTTRRHVDSIDVVEAPDGILIDVRAPSFVRGMVRRIVAAVLAVERGDARAEDLANALTSPVGVDFGQAPPEPLVLMDVDLGTPFLRTTDRASRLRVERRASETMVAARFWRELAERTRTIDTNAS